MKHLLVIAMLALVVNVRGETNVIVVRLEKIENLANELIIGTSQPPVAVSGDITMMPRGSNTYSVLTMTDEGIHKLAADGRICEVFGHCWERLTPETQSRIALYQNGREVVPCKCRICGKEETRTGDYK